MVANAYILLPASLNACSTCRHVLSDKLPRFSIYDNALCLFKSKFFFLTTLYLNLNLNLSLDFNHDFNLDISFDLIQHMHHITKEKNPSMSFQHQNVPSSTKNEGDGAKFPEPEVKTSWLAFLKVSNGYLFLSFHSTERVFMGGWGDLFIFALS